MIVSPLSRQERRDLVAELALAHEHRACSIRRMLQEDDAMRELNRLCEQPGRTFQVSR